MNINVHDGKDLPNPGIGNVLPQSLSFPAEKKTVPWLVLMKAGTALESWDQSSTAFLTWISLWLTFGHLLQWFFVVIAVIIKNPLWLSAVHTGAIDSIKKQPPSCMSAMISILLQSVADEESKKTPHHIFEKNSLMLWLVVTSCCPVLSWCCIITVAIAILYWLAANWWYITTSFSSAFLKLILEYCLTLVSWWYWQSPAAGHCCCFRLEALLTLWRRRKLAVSQEQKQLPPHPRRLVLKYFLSFPRFSVNLSS